MAGRRLERIPVYIGHGYLLNGESGKHQPTSIVAVRATARCWKNGRTSGKGLERGLQICRDTAPLAGGVRDMRVESLALSGAGWQPARDPEGAPFTAAVSCKRGSLADCQSAAAYQAVPQPSPLPCVHIR